MKNMYLHIGNNKIVRTRDVLGIFDADTATDEVPRAFVLYGDKNNENICFSLLSAKTLVRRNEAESEK